jgi:hypothetical protein
MNDQQIENLQVSFVLAVSCLDMSFFQAMNEMPVICIMMKVFDRLQACSGRVKLLLNPM